MKWISRIPRTVALAVGLVATGSAIAPVIEAHAADPPTARVLSVGMDPPAVVGRRSELRVSVAAGSTPASGVVVRFGPGYGFGSSSCEMSNIPGFKAEGPFASGALVRFAAPHRFAAPGTRNVLVRVDTGGCTAPASSPVRVVTVHPRRSNERTVPPQLINAPSTGVPALPGLGELPLPTIPTLLSRRRARCPGSGVHPSRSIAAVRSARATVLCLLNAHRRAHGLPSLRPSARLLEAAQSHSRAMVRRRFFSHDQPNGLDPLKRVQLSHYPRGAHHLLVGENIGYGVGPSSTPGWMVRAWMHSSPHRAAILDRRFRDVGIGITRGAPGRPRARGGTYTTDFGLRRR